MDTAQKLHEARRRDIGGNRITGGRAVGQERVIVENSTADGSRSTSVLVPIAGTSGSEMVDGQRVSSLKATVIDLNVACTCQSGAPKLSKLRSPKEQELIRMTATACRRKKHKPAETLFKSQKAIHILSKTSKNKKAGTVNELDEKRFTKYHTIVEEYKKNAWKISRK